MNIVLNGDTLKPVKQVPGHAYTLEEIAFFIPRKYVDYRFYLILTDGKKYDAVELKQANSTSQDYYNFVCNMAMPVKIASGTAKFSIIGFQKGEVTPSVMTSDLSLQFDNIAYNFKAQISLLENFSHSSAEIYNRMVDVYQKICDLSKLNIEIIQDKEESTE